jgi:histone acetyltransferase (RNA polymerase elongator complex component)
MSFECVLATALAAGHSVDKVEYILMGGTFMSLPAGAYTRSLLSSS